MSSLTCQKCGEKSAVFHGTAIDEGKLRVRHYCEACAAHEAPRVYPCLDYFFRSPARSEKLASQFHFLGIKLLEDRMRDLPEVLPLARAGLETRVREALLEHGGNPLKLEGVLRELVLPLLRPFPSPYMLDFSGASCFRCGAPAKAVHTDVVSKRAEYLCPLCAEEEFPPRGSRS